MTLKKLAVNLLMIGGWRGAGLDSRGEPNSRGRHILRSPS